MPPRTRPPLPFPLAALRFDFAATHRVLCGSAAIIDDLTAGGFTVLALVYPTVLTASRAMMSKFTSVGWWLGMSGTAGNFDFQISHTSNDLIYPTGDTPLAKLNQWYWVAATVDLTRGAGDRARLFAGPLSGGPLTRRTYGTLTEPTGSRDADAAADLYIGNYAGGTTNLAFAGGIALSAVWAQELAHEQLVQLTSRPTLRAFRESAPRGLWRPGWHTGRVLDESGNANHGTITGALPLQGPRIKTPRRIFAVTVAFRAPGPLVISQAAKRAAEW